MNEELEPKKNTKVERFKKHFKENKKVYIAAITTAVVTAVVTAIAVMKYQNSKGPTVIVDSYNINYKSPHTSVTQVTIPPRGNSGNAVQHDQTGAIYPSENFAAKQTGLNQGDISKQLRGLLPNVKGNTFTQLTENGVPVNAPV